MSNLYQLTVELHQLIQEKAKKYGLKLEIGAKFFIDLDLEKRNLQARIERCKEDGTIENALYVENQKLRIENYRLNPDYFEQGITADQIRQILVAFQNQLGIKVDKFEKKNLSFKHNEEGQLILPLFDREPEKVLTELLEILKNL
jgi:hypothetical protein